MAAWLIGILATLIFVFYLLTENATLFAELGGLERWILIIGMALSLVLAITLMFGYGERASTAVKHAMIWIAIFAGLIGVYAFKDDMIYVGTRMAGELAPPGTGFSTRDSDTGEVAVRIRKRLDGQFVARTRVNGASVTMLVDTGASTVVLTPYDARMAGIDVEGLSYTVPVRTANGTTYAAPARLRSVAVGAIRLSDVEALVAKAGNLNVSLLGMTFLNRVRSYGVAGNFLTLRN